MIRKLLFILCSVVCLNAAAQGPPAVDMRADTGEAANHQERIINFHSDISIDNTGLVIVAEHIKVYAAGDQILHGIVRFIPLYRKDIFGKRKKIDFEITNVQKNEKNEQYKTESDGDNRKIYVGEGDVNLDSGVYNYVITYQSHGHVGFFNKYDELYWNVTGNEWNFNIQKASATISFPNGAIPGNTSCYTGVAGSTSKNCNSVVNADHSVTFTASGALNPGEGFTVAAAFTPHIIKRPGFLQTILNDYLDIVAGIILLIFFAALYYYLWNKYGRDPVKPVVVPTFHVPNGWSPGLIRYFYKKLYDSKASAAALINMAVKGTIKIKTPEEAPKSYRFEKLNDTKGKLTEEEQAIFDVLLGDREHIDITQTNANIFVNARQAFAKSIKLQLNLAVYYKKNTWLTFWLTLLALAVITGYISLLGESSSLVVVFILPFIIIGLSSFISGIKAFKTAMGAAIFLLFFGAIFGGVLLIVTIKILAFTAPVILVVLLFMVAMYLFFIYNIKAYTQAGIITETDIEGFRMYLSTAEEHRLDLLNPPALTPQVFEKFLPYAIALDLENAWGEKFQEILQQTNYKPDWYDCTSGYYVFVTNMDNNSFYRSVNITPVSSGSNSSGSSSGSSGSSSWSSGSSGGGSSGGGGGGGGGGGW